MNNENANFFWERIKVLIKSNNTTQEWLAGQCDVTVGVFKSWIYNKRLPDAAQAARIARALKTSVEFLVTGEESCPLAEEVRQLKDKLNQISLIAKL